MTVDFHLVAAKSRQDKLPAAQRGQRANEFGGNRRQCHFPPHHIDDVRNRYRTVDKRAIQIIDNGLRWS